MQGKHGLCGQRRDRHQFFARSRSWSSRTDRPSKISGLARLGMIWINVVGLNHCPAKTFEEEPG